MSVNIEYDNLVPLGDYIELCDERNSDGKYTLDDVRGISILKKLIPTKADMQDVSLTPYKLLKPREFCYVTVTSRNGGKISLAINDAEETFMVSSSYLVFRTIDIEILLPEYLYILLGREEFDRLSRFNSWGSARETFDWSELCRIQIPLPEPEIQQELVDTYNGLKALAEQNEALIKPLTEACQAYIVDCKKKYPEVELGVYIEEVNERNTSNEITLTQGVDVNLQFIPAKREAADKEGTKIVRTGQFAFNKVVKANGTKLPFALRTGPDCIISSSYAVFQIRNQELDAKFLRLWFSRSEVHRYCGFISQGTTRDVFSYDDLCNLKIPLPPPAVQQAIVDIYNCAEEAKKIATQAREKMKNLCPALVQRAINS
jgi:type I restriction enzyme S subunit